MSFPAYSLVRLSVVLLLIASTSAACRRGKSPAAGATSTASPTPRVTPPPTASPPPQPVDAAAPVIDFDSRVHDFGVVNEGAVLEHTFVVKNQGNAPLVLSNVATSCGCTAAALVANTIPPGGSGPIEVTFSTRGRRGSGSKTIRVASNDSQHPTSVLEIKYDIQQLLGFEPPTVYLTAERGQDRVERVWLTGTLAAQAKPRVVRVEGGEGRVGAKLIKTREKGQVRQGLQLRLKAKKPCSSPGEVTVATGLANPAELRLPFQCSVK